MSTGNERLQLTVHSLPAPTTDDDGVTRIDLRKIEIRDQHGRTLETDGMLWGKVGPWLSELLEDVECEGEPVEDEVVVQRMKLRADQDYLVLVVPTS